MGEPLPIFTILDGRYRVDAKVGEGGFGAVYEGHHLHLETRVAIKVLSFGPGLGLEQRAERVAMFLDEGRILTRLHHPGIVTALDLGVFFGEGGEQTPYLVMEWVSGRTLREMLDVRERPLSLAEAWALFEPLLDAVAHAHAERVVHRDLKPSNVMVVERPDGALLPRVIDFGIAKLAEPDAAAGEGMTSTGSPCGFTPAYAAPEQVTRSRTGAWTDVHALGLLFTELVTGKAPYGDYDEASVAAVDPERPTPRVFGVEAGPLEPVLARALSLRPADRFRDAAELREALRAAMNGLSPMPAGEGGIEACAERSDTGGPSMRTLRPEPAPSPSRRGRGWLLALASAAALLGTGALVRSRAAGRVELALEPAEPAPASTGVRAAPALTLASLDADELSARAKRAGFEVGAKFDSPTSRTVSCTRGSQGWTFQTFVLGRAPTDVEGLMLRVAPYLRAGRGTQRVAYGGDDESFAIVSVIDGDAEAAFSAVFGGAPLRFFGTTYGDDPVARLEARLASAEASRAPSRRVRELRATELASRLRREGADPHTISPGPPTTIYFRRKGAQGTLLFYPTAGKAVLEARRAEGHALAFALDGDALVVIEGDSLLATKAFVASLLQGLGARVDEQKAR